MSSGALLRMVKEAQGAKIHTFGYRNVILAGRLNVTKENSKKISFLKISVFDVFRGVGLLKRAKGALTSQRSHLKYFFFKYEFGGPFKRIETCPNGPKVIFLLIKTYFLLNICTRSGPPQLGVVLVNQLINQVYTITEEKIPQ